jgi:phosphomannomutase
MPLDKDIVSYGVLIPRDKGDCLQREKLSEEQIRNILPEEVNDVYRSIGSFSVSLSFLFVLIELEWEALSAQGKDPGVTKSLNTDPDWWQPLTCDMEEYVELMAKKGRDREISGIQWTKMNGLWDDFSRKPSFKLEKQTTGVYRKLGYKDLGKNAIWWDYGQNKYYFRNIKLLTGSSAEAEAARNFFGIEEKKWISGKCDIAQTVKIDKSVVLDSTIKTGRVTNCVIINSDLGHVDIEDSIVIDSKVINLRMRSGLCYNNIGRSVSAGNGHVIVNVFHPELGRIPMRTSIFRDGEADYKKGPEGKGAYIFDNLFTYKEIARFNSKVKIKDALNTRQRFMQNITEEDIFDSSPSLVRELTKRRKISPVDARKIVAHRMLIFGDAEYFTYESYAQEFEVDITTAEIELRDLADEKSDIYNNKYNSLAGVEKKSIRGSKNKEMEGQIVFSAIPGQNRKEVLKKVKPLRFGTSGLRALVGEMTDMECYINTRGFINFLEKVGEIVKGTQIAIGGDRRESTPRIMASAKRAVSDAGYVPVNCGLLPSPALAYFAMGKGIPSIMVTGSHVPADRNGIKFTKKSGEVLKSDEQDILEGVARARAEEYSKAWKESIFDENFMFKSEEPLPESSNEAIDFYIERYTKVFAPDSLKDSVGNSLKIVVYQHSAVGRDILKKILESLGAEVISIGRSEQFVPVDTEKISETSAVSKKMLVEWAEEYAPFSIVSTDGDSDRPLVTDENGKFIPGDKLGALVSMFLHPDFAAVPVSANDAVIQALPGRGIRLVQTKIGSPYVIKAMTDELVSSAGKAKVVGWEVNGGFLTGSDWHINGDTLRALPTRDAVLPIIAVFMLAAGAGKPLSAVVTDTLPVRETFADVIDNKTKGPDGRVLIPEYTTQLGKNIVKALSPADKNISASKFNGNGIEVFYADGKKIEASNAQAEELTAIKNKLEGYYEREGFKKVVYINWVDGIKIEFENGEVSHLRPSGNAPEFRNYSQASTMERAYEIVEKRKKIIPELLKDIKGG